MTTAAPARTAAPAPIAEELDIRKVGDTYWAFWTSQPVRMSFRHIRESYSGPVAEVAVFVDIPGAPSPAERTMLNLLAYGPRAQIAKMLSEQWPGPGAPAYRDMLRRASGDVTDLFRTGESLQRIGRGRALKETRYALYPILPEGQISILYGDGASAKSLMAMAIALSVQEARQLLTATTPGMTPASKRPVLYLDYETNGDEQNARLKRVAAGFGLTDYQEMLYRECHQSLPRDAEALRTLADEHDVPLVVVDSLGAALGGDPNDAETVIASMNVLRSLKKTVLCIDHVTKTDSDGKPLGSAYKFNYSRAAWHVKRVQEAGSDSLNIALVHKKANNGALVPPLGYNIRFDGDTGPITIRHQDIREVEELQSSASAPSRIRYALRHGALDTTALKDAVGTMATNTFNHALDRMKKSGEVIVFQGNRYALNAEFRR